MQACIYVMPIIAFLGKFHSTDRPLRILVRIERVELPTYELSARCSTTELYAHYSIG